MGKNGMAMLPIWGDVAHLIRIRNKQTNQIFVHWAPHPPTNQFHNLTSSPKDNKSGQQHPQYQTEKSFIVWCSVWMNSYTSKHTCHLSSRKTLHKLFSLCVCVVPRTKTIALSDIHWSGKRRKWCLMISCLNNSITKKDVPNLQKTHFKCAVWFFVCLCCRIICSERACVCVSMSIEIHCLEKMIKRFSSVKSFCSTFRGRCWGANKLTYYIGYWCSKPYANVPSNMNTVHWFQTSQQQQQTKSSNSGRGKRPKTKERRTKNIQHWS